MRAGIDAHKAGPGERALALAHLSIELLKLDRLDEAEATAREALETAQKGDEQAAVAEIMSRVDLATVYLSQARYAEAELVLGNALEILKGVQEPRLRFLGHDLAGALAQAEGRYLEADASFHTAHDAAVEGFGSESVEVATVSQQMAMLQLQRGDYAEADRLVSESLPILEAKLSPKDPQLALAVLAAALVDETLGRYASAELHYTQALKYAAGGCTPHGLIRAHAEDQLATFELLRGQLPLAEALAHDAAETYASHLGPEHPEVGEASAVAGRAAVLQGHLDEARTQLARARRILARDLGVDHPRFAFVEESEGLLAMADGHNDEARSHFERAIAIQEAVTGPKDPNLLLALAGLGDVQLRSGDLDGAAATYERVLAIEDGVLHRDHPQLRPVVKALAHIYLTQKRFDDAEKLVRSVVDARIARLGPQDPSVADAWADLGEVYDTWRWYPQAIDAYSRALKIAETLKNPDPSVVGQWRFQLGTLLIDGRRPKEAVPLLEQVLAQIRAQKKPEDANLATLLDALGSARSRTGDLDGAERDLREALRIRRALFDSHSPVIAGSLGDLGVLQVARGNLIEAKVLFREAREINEEALGPDALEVGDDIHNLGMAYRAEGNYSAARDSFEFALRITEKKLGPDHVRVARIRMDLGTSEVKLGQVDAGAKDLERALAIVEATPGADPTKYEYALADARKAQGRDAEGLALLARAIRTDPKLDEEQRKGQLAVTLARQATAEGRNEDATKRYEEALALSNAGAGSALDRIIVLRELAEAQAAKGNYAEAAATMEQLLGMLRPDARPDLAEGIARLKAGAWYVWAGQTERGEAQIERAAEIATTIGEPSLEVDALSNLAWARTRRGAIGEAQRDVARGESVMRAHPDVKASSRFLFLGVEGDLLRVQDRTQEARQIYARAVETYDAGGVEKPKELAELLQKWAVIEAKSKSDLKVEALAKRAYDVRRAFLGHDDDNCAELLSLRASALMDMGKDDEAIATYEKAIAAYSALGPAKNPRRSLTLEALGHLHARAGHQELALAKFKAARALIRPAGDTAEQYGWLLSETATTCFALKQLDCSEQSLSQALALLEPRVPKTDKRIGQLRRNLEAVRKARRQRDRRRTANGSRDAAGAKP